MNSFAGQMNLSQQIPTQFPLPSPRNLLNLQRSDYFPNPMGQNPLLPSPVPLPNLRAENQGTAVSSSELGLCNQFSPYSYSFQHTYQNSAQFNNEQNLFGSCSSTQLLPQQNGEGLWRPAGRSAAAPDQNPFRSAANEFKQLQHFPANGPQPSCGHSFGCTVPFMNTGNNNSPQTSTLQEYCRSPWSPWSPWLPPVSMAPANHLLHSCSAHRTQAPGSAAAGQLFPSPPSL